ncbi:hypothetical protein ACK8QS_22855 (plasmid) [Ectopseudomonas mendocina]
MARDWDVAFHSGMSAQGDLIAAVAEGVAVGVVALNLNLIAKLRVIPQYLDNGGAVFIDSGAFSAFVKGELVDWQQVFSAYETIIDRTDRADGLSIVAPDVVGDQAATIALWEQHAPRIQSWMASGARVIIPLQCGERSAGELLALAKAIFQTDRFCAGVPSNLAAMTAEGCLTLQHHDFHILGRVVLTAELEEKMAALYAGNPCANYTADANWMRSRIRRISEASRALGSKIHPAGIVLESKRTRGVRAVLRAEAYSDKHQRRG